MAGKSLPPGLTAVQTLAASCRRTFCRRLSAAAWAVAGGLIPLNRVAAGLRRLADRIEILVAHVVGGVIHLALRCADAGIEPGAPGAPTDSR